MSPLQVIRAFQDGASPESIFHRYSTLSLSDIDNTIRLLSSSSKKQ
nr:hypothetical protein [Acaryochloris sp. CCMEE 5410]